MASGDENVENGESLTPKQIAPRASSREHSPVIQPPSKNLPENCSAVRAGKNVDSKSLQKNLPESIRRAQRNVDRSHGDIHRRQAPRARVLVLALATQIPK